MKKTVYITSFIFLGILFQLIVHGLLETLCIDLLLKDFSKYGLGLSWNNWFLIHHIATVILLILGILFGFWQGKYWWRKIYEQDIRNLNKD